MAELEGRTLGRYELRRLIGKGGMANVYEAFDTLSGRVIAVKIFKREDDELLSRFLREAQLMSALHGHHLVPIYFFGTEVLDNALLYYIAMPFLPGGTLRARIRRGPLTLDETCRALSEIADALDYVHSQGIIHRDIKASNVLIDSDGGYYLADFGIARITSDLTHMTTTGNVLGTVDYVAPELFEVDRKANAFSDLYSLGVLLYEMVTGRLPFIAENQIALVTMHMRQRPPAPRGIDPRIPAAVERVMLKALEKRPEQRYHSAAELARAFCLAVNADDVMLISPASATPGLLAPVFKQEQLVLSPHDVGTADFISPIYEPAELVAASSLAPGRDVPAAPSYVPVSAATSRAARRARPRDTRPFYRHPLFVLVVVLLAFTIIAGS
ncbi:MAG TPA: serine/threonine-protein kinase, partial [Ktedonobacteraceae bacterium]|nr:serine/threonine-protein kinase [Ktedonobacteraceae bacterium]